VLNDEGAGLCFAVESLIASIGEAHDAGLGPGLPMPGLIQARPLATRHSIECERFSAHD
jgi:hypothetical protein